MERKPSHPKLPGRQAMWQSIRTLATEQGSFTRKDVSRLSRVTTSRCTAWMKGLVQAGYLEETPSPGAGTPARYRLISNPGAEAPRINEHGQPITKGLAEEAMWRTMKRLGAFRVEELALLSSTEEVEVKAATARCYLTWLGKADYVRLNKGRYTFVKPRDPGPLPPQAKRAGHVFDPNSRTVVWSSIAEEDV